MTTLDEYGVEGFTTRRVALSANTSVPAVYELFGDKGGLVRELFFEAFRRLRAAFDQLDTTDDPVADVFAAVLALRRFTLDNPGLFAIMFQRPFTEFDPSPDDLDAGTATRTFLVDRARRCVDAGLLHGNPTDMAHALLALAQGLALQESGGWLGTSTASANRRWRGSVTALVDGYRCGNRT